MKIALVRKEFNELHGGAERYAVNLAKRLAKFGHDVHILRRLLLLKICLSVKTAQN
jgi:hypothetical protein